MNLRRGLLIAVLSIAAVGCILLALDKLAQDEENYSLIEPGLYMGGDVKKPPRGTQAVLNLCEAQDSYSSRVYLHEPIRDGEPVPDLAWLGRMVDFIDSNRQADRTVFVHCRNGVSRSGMVVTAYLMVKHNWSRDRAIEFIRLHRPLVRPNPAFMELLLKWEREKVQAR